MHISRQSDFLQSGRQNQKHRTREALINAAIALVRDGHSPSIAEVAEAAKVSPATAYRYFPNPNSLYGDVAIREQTASSVAGLPERLPEDPQDRIEIVVRAVSRAQFAEEALWRAVLRAVLDRWFEQTATPDAEPVPVRGTTRLDMARTALAPLADTLAPAQFERLTHAAILVFGVEAMITTRDVSGLDPDTATDVMSWAARALVRAALAEATT